MYIQVKWADVKGNFEIARMIWHFYRMEIQRRILLKEYQYKIERKTCIYI